MGRPIPMFDFYTDVPPTKLLEGNFTQHINLLEGNFTPKLTYLRSSCL